MLQDVLLDAVHLVIERFGLDVGKPGIIALAPDNRAIDIGNQQGIKQLRKNKNLHVGQGEG